MSDKTTYEWTRLFAKKEGILVGPTSGAGAYVAEHLAQRPDYENKTIIFIICDTGERYLSTPDLFEIDNVERIS